jgi:hypothetical protein
VPAESAERHFNLVYAQELGCGGMLAGGNDKVDSSETLGSVNIVGNRAGNTLSRELLPNYIRK